MGFLLDLEKEKINDAINEQYNNSPSNNSGWDDLVNSLIGRRLNSVAGSVAYNYSENAISFSPNGNINSDNDCVVWNLQKPHATKSNSTLNLHLHYEQSDNIDREFTLRYRIQNNGTSKTTTWTEVIIPTNTNNAFIYTSGTLNQICKLVNIDWSAVNLSSTVQLRLTRSDSVSGAINVTFVDGHVERDQDRGSRQEYVK